MNNHLAEFKKLHVFLSLFFLLYALTYPLLVQKMVHSFLIIAGEKKKEIARYIDTHNEEDITISCIRLLTFSYGARGIRVEYDIKNDRDLHYAQWRVLSSDPIAIMK